MKTFATNITDEEVRKAVRYWVDLLGRGKFSDAADMLLPEIIPANGSVDEKEHLQWTG
jgi:hypothetical protein